MFIPELCFIECNDSDLIIYCDETRKLIKVSVKLKNRIENYLQGLNYDIVIEKMLLEQNIIFNTEKEYEKFKIQSKYLKLKQKISIHTVYMHLTQKCNLRCTYCYDKEKLNSVNELNTNEWKLVIEKLLKIGVKNFVFTGGEVFLRRDLDELVKFAKEKKY